MSSTSQTREIGPLSMRAEIVPGSLNDQDRTVEVIWTTGARVLRSTWWDGDFYEELSLDPKHVRMERFQSGRAPHLIGHNGWDPDAHVGVLESAALEKKRGVGKLRVLKDDEQADKEWNKIRQGIRTSFSVGYRVYKYEKTEAGEGTIPVYRAVDWEPYEVSSVPMPADIGAHTRSATDRGALNPCQVINVTRGEPPQKEQHTMSKENPQAAPTDQAATARAATEAHGAQVNEDQVRAAERERISTIQALVRKHGVDEAVAAKLVADNATVEQARKAVLDALATRSDEAGISSHQRVTGGEDEKDKRLRGMSGWLFERANATETIEGAKKNARLSRHFKDAATDGGEFRGMSLADLARECLERDGVKTRGMSRMDMIGRAFTHRSGGYQTTSDFGLLFENVMHKLLLGAYATAPDTWRRIAKTDTVPDFRTSNRYRNGSFGVLDSKTEAGEFKNKAIPDGAKSTISTGTKGNIIALTREAIINDDMGALADVASRFGRAAGLSVETDVYALLTANSGLGPTMSDGNTFFHATRGNIGAAGALSVDSLDADRVTMASLKDQSNNDFLDLRPRTLVVPIGLGGRARIYNQAQYDPDVTSKFQVPNKVVGLFGDVLDSPRLSGTRRYMLVDPAIAAAFVVVFLEGSGEAPVMETQDGWRVDGTEWKLRIDYKAQAFDPKGALTNAGA
ncbi:prohead protease/major capsid protein fusion protein [Myxococcus stipitatus]|nr:prohead protease/major capsid protein fusion protein [Myxococcus stipitatus]